MTRQAISPRLAMRIFLNIGSPRDESSGFPFEAVLLEPRGRVNGSRRRRGDSKGINPAAKPTAPTDLSHARLSSLASRIRQAPSNSAQNFALSVRRRRSGFPASREFSCALFGAPIQEDLQYHGVASSTTHWLQTRAPLEQGISNDRNRELSGDFGADQGKNRRAKTGREIGRRQVVRRDFNLVL